MSANRVPHLEGAGGLSPAIRDTQLDSADEQTSANRVTRLNTYGEGVNGMSPSHASPSINNGLHAYDGMDDDIAIHMHRRWNRQNAYRRIGHDANWFSRPGGNLSLICCWKDNEEGEIIRGIP